MSQNNSAQNSEQQISLIPDVAPAFKTLPLEYPTQGIKNRDDYCVVVCKTDELAPAVWRDMLMLMRKGFNAQIGDVVMVNPEYRNPRLEFCKVAGLYPAVCVAAKPQLLEILPDGTVSKPA